MTVALSDAALLADMLQPLPNFADQLATANRTAAFYTKRKPLSATINTLANALYRVSTVSRTQRLPFHGCLKCTAGPLVSKQSHCARDISLIVRTQRNLTRTTFRWWTHVKLVNDNWHVSQVFCYTGDKAHEVMRQACFDYLRLGGMYSSGPISLLSGMNPRPSILVMHFFMVAIFGVGRCDAALLLTNHGVALNLI